MNQETVRRRENASSRPMRVALALSWLIVVLAIVTSAAGLAARGLYQDESTWATAALRGGDLATLMVFVPLLIGSLLLTSRGSARARLVWIGLLAYGVYNFAYYVFGAAFNSVFLLHVALFALSLYALVLALVATDAEAIAARFDAGTPVRTVGGFLAFVAGLFATLWTVFSLRYAIEGHLELGAATLDGMHLVFALDLALMAPSLAVAGVMLWRRHAWGYVLATALAVFGAAYQWNLAVAGYFQWQGEVVEAKMIDPMGVGVLLAFLAAAVVMLRHLGPADGRSSAGSPAPAGPT